MLFLLSKFLLYDLILLRFQKRREKKGRNRSNKGKIQVGGRGSWSFDGFDEKLS